MSTAILSLTACSNATEHVCWTGEVYLHHSPLDKPFSDETTEHMVGECDDCAEWNPPPENGSTGADR